MLNLHRARQITNKLGAGLITGAADDDPSGLATYSQAGAQFGTSLLWTMAFTTPLMIAIQMVSARIGWFTGRGLAANIRRVMPGWLTLPIVLMLVFANTLNISADVAAMGAALQLVIGGPEHGHALLFGLLCTVLPLWLGFQQMVRLLKWLTLALLAYVAVVFMLHVHWGAVFADTFAPKILSGGNYWMMVVAVLGTTISPYLFFWQSAQEAEQRQLLDAVGGDAALAGTRLFAEEHLDRIRLDTVIGMVFSNLIAFCVMLATALTLHQNGITDIQTTRQAAEALRPLAGEFAFTLFALGIVGTGMLAVPVLAASSAYAVAEAMDWNAGLNHELIEARGFYAVIAAGTLIGTALDFTFVDPIKALLWSAVVNGTIAVPIMAVMLLIAARADVLGEHVISTRHRVMGWFTTAVMAVAVVAMIIAG